jgi:phosphatidylglycerophosphate synthase
MHLSDRERQHLLTRQHPPTTDLSQVARLLQPFWNASLRFVPARMAPNTLTVLGSLAVVVPTAVLLWCSPDLRQPVPPLVLLLQIVGIFTFQTLDALDGKQARRTGASSPLGSWLDHALDIVTMQLVLLGVCAAVQAGIGLATWTMLAGTILNNHFLHWESSHTRMLILGNGTSIAEAQVSAMLVNAAAMLAPGAFTSSFSVAGIDVTLGAAVLVGSVTFVGGAGIVGSVQRALSAGVPRAESIRQLVGIVALLLPATIAVVVVTDEVSRALLGAGVLLVGARSIGRLVLENLLLRTPSTIDVPTVVSAVISIAAVAIPTQAVVCAVLSLLVGVVSIAAFYVHTSRSLACELGEHVFVLSTERR